MQELIRHFVPLLTLPPTSLSLLPLPPSPAPLVEARFGSAVSCPASCVSGPPWSAVRTRMDAFQHPQGEISDTPGCVSAREVCNSRASGSSHAHRLSVLHRSFTPQPAPASEAHTLNAGFGSFAEKLLGVVPWYKVSCKVMTRWIFPICASCRGGRATLNLRQQPPQNLNPKP